MSARPSYPIVPPGAGDFRGEAGGEPAAQWKATAAGEKLVPTHCSFCGVQCGMYLRVSEGRVIGVEPRDHDINKMRLCPKGVVAYQQVHHPDRLLTPLMRESRDAPLRPVSWDAALDRVVDEMRRISSATRSSATSHDTGRSGASLVSRMSGVSSRSGWWTCW